MAEFSSVPIRWPALFAAALLMTACGTAPRTSTITAEPEPASTAIEQTPEERGAGNRTGEAADETAAGSEETPRVDLPEPELPQLASVPPTADLPGPEGLIGLGREQVRALLGTPGFVRRDPPAELWQYGTDGCFLDLFLYRNESKGELRVTHVEARGKTVAAVPARDCYLSLLDRGGEN